MYVERFVGGGLQVFCTLVLYSSYIHLIFILYSSYIIPLKVVVNIVLDRG